MVEREGLAKLELMSASPSRTKVSDRQSNMTTVHLQKWSKGKMKEKVNNQVLFDQVGHVSDFSRIYECLGVEQADIAVILQ